MVYDNRGAQLASTTIFNLKKKKQGALGSLELRGANLYVKMEEAIIVEVPMKSQWTKASRCKLRFRWRVGSRRMCRDMSP